LLPSSTSWPTEPVEGFGDLLRLGEKVLAAAGVDVEARLDALTNDALHVPGAGRGEFSCRAVRGCASPRPRSQRRS
jgi:hypothetical protein